MNTSVTTTPSHDLVVKTVLKVMPCTSGATKKCRLPSAALFTTPDITDDSVRVQALPSEVVLTSTGDVPTPDADLELAGATDPSRPCDKAALSLGRRCATSAL
ncbi:hypothetical protein MRX96_007842 [Rhipicephalus microplus]